jgi:hypothetical protein
MFSNKPVCDTTNYLTNNLLEAILEYRFLESSSEMWAMTPRLPFMNILIINL